MCAMEIDQIQALAATYAAQLKVEKPTVTAGRPSSWYPSGLRGRLVRRTLVLIADSRFEQWDPAEQEAEIAHAVAGAAVHQRHRQRIRSISFIPLALAALIVGVTAAWLTAWAGRLPIYLFLTIIFIVTIIRSARNSAYDRDRVVVENFGWPIIDHSLELHRKTPFTGLNPNRLFIPNPDQRSARLDRLREQTADAL